jgi:hypothetical protein
MWKKYKWWIVGGIALLVIGTTTTLIILNKRRKGNRNPEKYQDKNKNIIVGDSQTPFIAKNTTKAIILSSEGSEEVLWKGGKNLSWLRDAVKKYKESPDINAVIINIGTNGGFSKKDDVNGLFEALKKTFPNADFFAVKGSWGWGGNKDKTEQMVNEYYNLFAEKGAKVIEPAIGKVQDPHGNLPIYAEIGKSIDKALS